VFENIIEQDAVLQLRDDIKNGRYAPSMLFFGPGESGKGSAALELARVFSCEEKGDWKCSCYSCQRHRFLQHDDLLALGKRVFPAEIMACSSVFMRNPANNGAKLIFMRSLRKLLLRFSPVFLEDDPKLSKLASVIQSLDEELSDFWVKADSLDETALKKTCNSMIKNALVLESEGISSNISIGHIRSASYWCRLAPNGKRKTLIIENAENMRDEGRNSLLKLLEEPPPSVCIVLTAKRKEAIMPTILSRLRPYRFLKRSIESEKEVIRRVFHDSGTCLNEYLDSFLPQSTEKLYPLAAWFLVSLARISSMSAKKENPNNIPPILNALGERYAPIAESAGLERCLKSAGVIKILLSQSGNFEDSSFTRFLKICLEMVGDVTKTASNPEYILYNDAFRKNINETINAVDVLNISKAIALEALFYKLKKALNKKAL